MKKVDRFPKQAESDLTYLVDQKNCDRRIKQLLLNLVIANYHDFSVSCRSIICLGLWQISGNGNNNGNRIYVPLISLYGSLWLTVLLFVGRG